MADVESQQPRSLATSQTASAETLLRQRSQELGLIGKIFGSKEHAPINIAGALVVLGVLGLIATPFVPEGHSFTQADMAKALGSIVLAALTFLGGYLGGGTK